MMFPVIVFALGFFFIIAPNQFLGGGFYAGAVPSLVGGYALVLIAIWSTAAYWIRHARMSEQRGFDVLPSNHQQQPRPAEPPTPND